MAILCKPNTKKCFVSRPAMFIAVGLPGFTALALIGLVKAWTSHYNYFGDQEVTSQILQVMATMTGFLSVPRLFGSLSLL